MRNVLYMDKGYKKNCIEGISFTKVMFGFLKILRNEKEIKKNDFFNIWFIVKLQKLRIVQINK